MSIQQLLIPNDYSIYLGNIVVNTINTDNLFIDSINLDNTQTRILSLNSTSNLVEYRNNIVDTNSTQTLTNKTLNSASNTLEVNGTNINSLINQAVLTSSSPSFVNVTLSSVNLDNTQTQILALNSTTGLIDYRNNIVDTNSTQTLTNKTLNSASNTLEVNGTNINSLINQAVLTSSSPTFVGETINNSSNPTLTLSDASHSSLIGQDTSGAHFFTNSTAGSLCVQSATGNLFLGVAGNTASPVYVVPGGLTVISNINNPSGILNLQSANVGPVAIGDGTGNIALEIGGSGVVGAHPSFAYATTAAAYTSDYVVGDLLYYQTTANSFRFGFTNAAASQLYINSSGTFCNANLTINSGANILLPTAGGTAANLNYYEEYSSAANATGPFSSGQATTLYIFRIGSICKCMITGLTASATSSTTISISVTIPSRLRPIIGLNMPINVFNNSANVFGSIGITTGGVITIYAGSGTGNFTGSGTAGFLGISVDWVV
jgi:hypothetical protein